MFIENKRLFLSVYVDDIKMAGKRQNMAPMNNVDMDEPTSFLHHVYLGCTQRECKPLLNNIRRFFNHVFLLEERKITGMGKTSRENCCVVLRHGRTCSKMCRAIL